MLDLRMMNCVDDDADDNGRGGLGLQENVAMMERDQRSDFRMLARGGGYTDVGGGDHDVDPGRRRRRRKGGESCFAVDDDVAGRLRQIDGRVEPCT